MTLMPLASEVLKRLIPSFSLSMIRVDPSCSPQHHYSEFFDEFSHQQFAIGGQHFTAQTGDPASFGTLLRSKVPYGNLVNPPSAYYEGMIYEHFFKRNGIHHVLDVALRDANGPLGILGIFREEKAPPFTRSDVALIHEIYPLLVHASVAKPVPARFDDVGSAMIVASPQGVILWASEQARRWLEDACASAERAALMERDLLPEACRMLWKRVAEHQSGTPQRGARLSEVPTRTLRVPGGRLRLRAYPLEPQSTERAGAIGVHLTLEMHRSLRVLRVLERAPVGPQLRRLALGLWRGASAASLREELGVSASTLKSYQKELYARLAVNSLDDLVEHLESRSAEVTFDLHRHLPRPAPP